MPAAKTRTRSTKSKTEKAVAKAARFGLAARGGFYLLLAGLVVNLAVEGTNGPQADANGALSTVASNPVGEAAVVAVAVGFFAFGATRLWSVWHDRRPSAWPRTTTALQGAFYLALTWVPLSYVLGNRSAGSNKSQHKIAGDLLRLPGGREIVIALGLIVIGVCINQIRTALSQDYADGMRMQRAPRWTKWLVRSAATFGIPARALVFVPVGVFFIVSAVQHHPNRAKGIDQVLAKLPGHWWGELLLVVVAAGLLVFATYSFLEARYRKVLHPE
ncbi:MAG: DUF1206 domain-containing protein [Mycobacteriales bacterium]